MDFQLDTTPPGICDLRRPYATASGSDCDLARVGRRASAGYCQQNGKIMAQPPQVRPGPAQTALQCRAPPDMTLEPLVVAFISLRQRIVRPRNALCCARLTLGAVGVAQAIAPIANH